MKIPKPTREIEQSSEYHYLYGRFELGDAALPYLVIAMPLIQAARELKIAEDAMPHGFEGANIRELFQRQVNWDRVEHEIVPYLRKQDQPVFFNALTIVAVASVDEEFVSYDDERLLAPTLTDLERYEEVLNAGPLALGLYRAYDSENITHSLKIGKVAWHRDQIKCLAIDGQHRLGAIQELMNTGKDKPALKNSYVTVIMVTPSRRLGYKSDPPSTSTIGLMRSLFTDLNQYSVQVNRARRILLDDYDPQSTCVRRLIQTDVRPWNSNWSLEDPTRLPLTLVDWHTDVAKFDEGPYLTTILSLDNLVQKVSGIPPIRDWTDNDQVKKQVNTFKGWGWVPTQKCEERLERLITVEGVPFSYPKDDLRKIGEAFAGNWAAAFVHLLTHVKAYSELIQFRSEQQMLNPDFVMWYHTFVRCTESGTGLEKGRAFDSLEKVERHLQEEEKAQILQNWKKIVGAGDSSNELRARKDSRGLPFRVVFQRATFAALSSLSGRSRVEEDEESLSLSPAEELALEISNNQGSHRFLWARDLTNFLNHAEAATPEDQFLTLEHRTTETLKTFWLGTIANAEKPSAIDFTSAAADRASYWLELGVLLSFYQTHVADFQLRPRETEETWDEYWSDVSHCLSDTAAESINQVAGRIGLRSQQRAFHPMQKVVVALNGGQAPEPKEEFDRQIEQEFLARFDHIISVINHPTE